MLLLILNIQLVVLVLQVDHGQVNANEGYAGRRALAYALQIALVVVVEQLLEFQIHLVRLEAGSLSGDLESSHGACLERRVNLLQTAKVIHCVKVVGNVKESRDNRHSLLDVVRVHDALGVPVNELVRQRDELCHVR